MAKKLAKIIALGMSIIMALGIFAGCVDYGYEFHFSVVGGNGDITLENEALLRKVTPCSEASWCELECPENSNVINLLGGEKGQLLKLIAIPDEGYQVKEWLFNGKVVDENKTNSYSATVTSEHDYNGVIAVVFEPIQSN